MEAKGKAHGEILGAVARGSMTGQAAKETLMERVSRLLRGAKSPIQKLITIYNAFREVRPWTMPEGYQVRMSVDYLETAFGDDGDAVKRSRRMERDKHLEKCNAWKTHRGISDVLNAFVLRDRLPDIINTEGFERLCRWAYGLEMVMEEVEEEKDWKGGGNELKTRWRLLAEYHPTELGRQDRIGDVDAEVEDKLRKEALFQK